MKDIGLTQGYPSVEKVWRKNYTEEALCAELPEQTIYEYLYSNNIDRMNMVAITYFNKKITYGELFNNINIAASQLAELGVKPGDIVTIISSNTPETVYLIYALNLIGAIPNLEYPTMTVDFIEKEIEETESRFLVILDVLVDKYEVLVKKINHALVISVSDSMPFLIKTIYNLKAGAKISEKYRFTLKKSCSDFSKVPYEKNKTAIIMHSGGTTGIPKGVELTNENINAIAVQHKYGGIGYNVGETFMHSIPPFHAFGFSVGIHTPLCLGLNVIGALRFDEEYVRNMFYKNKPTHFVTGGTFARAILKDKSPSFDMSYLKTFAVGGSSVPKDELPTLNKFLESHNSPCRVVTGYGMSEFSATVCNERNDCYNIGSVGIPLPFVNAKVVSTEDGTELKYNEVGELCFNSPSMMKKYYKNPRATSEIVKTDENGAPWIHTGDCGYIDEKGFVFITGRIKRIYTTKLSKDALFKLFPDYIETSVKRVPGVADCAVVCVKHEIYNFVPILFYTTLSDNAAELEAKIKEFCLKELPDYSQPYEMRMIDKLPLTPVGKYDYVALEKMC